MTAFEEAIAQMAAILEEERVPYMVIGGAATTLWGSTRATRDVDVTVWVDQGKIAETAAQLARRLPHAGAR